MGQREDAERDFERIFGKVESRNSDSSESPPTNGATQKLPSDSDVLGIRTDSDRFIMKNTLPERLPIEPAPQLPSVPPGADTPHRDSLSPPEAMTIALNVVFTNVPQAGEGAKAGDSTNPGWMNATQVFARKATDSERVANGPTFFIPLPIEPRAGDTSAFTSPQHTQRAGGELPQTLSANGGSPGIASSPTANFAPLHAQDAVKISNPSAAPLNPSGASVPHSGMRTAPPAAPTPSGPSDFTRIVNGSELRALQEKFAAASDSVAATAQSTWPGPPPQAMVLQPVGMATQIWSASSAPLPQQQSPMSNPWPVQIANLPLAPKPPEMSVEPSKLSQYMPLILMLNLFLLLAILLVVFFALKK